MRAKVEIKKMPKRDREIGENKMRRRENTARASIVFYRGEKGHKIHIDERRRKDKKQKRCFERDGDATAQPEPPVARPPTRTQVLLT